jgi:hypothetical protein
MDTDGKLRFAAQSLVNAERVLRKAADAYPFLDGPGRAFRRMARAADRPLRIGILGEANSGKSSLANLLAGVPALPVAPVVNTRLPALLKYAPKPSITAVYESGESVDFLLCQDVAQAVAAIQDSAGKGIFPGGKGVPASRVKLLEVGLPSGILRSIEILDLPAGHPGLPGYGMDAVIWTTVATQAWCESERAQWTKLPQAVRSRSLLAVTFCDLAAGRENNLKRLQARLEASAKPYFRGICYVANEDLDPAAAASRNKVLFVQIQYLAQQFAAERFGKAMAVAHRVMAKAAAKPARGIESGRNVHSSHPVEKASEALSGGDWGTVLKLPLPERRLEMPPIPRGGQTFGAAASTGARGITPASHSSATGKKTKERPRWMTIGMAAAVAGAATLVAIQQGLIGTGTLVSKPLPSISEAAGRGAMEKAETRRKAEAEAAAAEEGRRAVAEAVAAGERRDAQAQAVAAEARRIAQAEAAAEPKRRRKAAAGRRGSAEPEEAERRGRVVAAAVLHQYSGSGPIMHGVSQ